MTTSSTPQVSDVLSDLAYDWTTVLPEKAKALQAYDKYIEDARGAGS